MNEKVKRSFEYITTLLEDGFDGDYSDYAADLKIIEQALDQTDFFHIVKSVYSDLCRTFLDLCEEHPHTPWDQIPEAVAATEEAEKYKSFVLKYYNIDLSPRQLNK